MPSPRVAAASERQRERQECQHRRRDEDPVHAREDAAHQRATIIGPCGRSSLVQVLDREGFVIERERELRRDQREPPAGRALDVRDAVVEPAAILLHLTGHLTTAVVGAKGLEPTRRARKRSDGEVPSRVGADERAPIHDATVPRGPWQHGHERHPTGDDQPDRARAPPRSRARLRSRARARSRRQHQERHAQQRLWAHQRRDPEHERPGGYSHHRAPRRPRRFGSAAPCHADRHVEAREHEQRRQRLGHEQRPVEHEPGMERDQRAGHHRAPW